MAERSARKPKDLVLVRGRTEDGNALDVIRSRDDRLETGIMKPLEDGKPLEGEVVKLTPRAECPLLFDAETQFSKDAPDTAPQLKSRSSNGPAQVASDDYRRNWDAIWKRRKKSTVLN
jgi:hypothetical protein